MGLYIFNVSSPMKQGVEEYTHQDRDPANEMKARRPSRPGHRFRAIRQELTRAHQYQIFEWRVTQRTDVKVGKHNFSNTVNRFRGMICIMIANRGLG